MPTYRDEAVVLQTQRLGEADRIVTLLGRERGLIRAVGKGVRRTSSKFGSRLEPFTVIDAQFFQGRSLDTVTQAVTLAAYGAELVADLDAYAAASAMAETAGRLAETEHGRPLYLLLLGGLRALARSTAAQHPAPPRQLLDSYLLRALAVAGWAPSFVDCARCGAAGPHRRISVQQGGAVCANCAQAGAPAVSPAVTAQLTALLAGDWDAVAGCPASDAARASGIVAAYAQFHLERPLRSLRILDAAPLRPSERIA